MFKVKITANFKVLMNVCPDDIFWITEPFTTKLGMVMHYYYCQIVFWKDWFAVIKVKVTVKRLVCCHQGQGHSEGSYNQNTTFKYVIWTADPFAAKLGLMAHHHTLDCLVKRLDCSVVVKVKVTKGLKFYWMVIWIIPPQLLNLLKPNLVWWCIIMG